MQHRFLWLIVAQAIWNQSALPKHWYNILYFLKIYYEYCAMSLKSSLLTYLFLIWHHCFQKYSYSVNDCLCLFSLQIIAFYLFILRIRGWLWDLVFSMTIRVNLSGLATSIFCSMSHLTNHICSFFRTKLLKQEWVCPRGVIILKSQYLQEICYLFIFGVMMLFSLEQTTLSELEFDVVIYRTVWSCSYGNK